MKQYSEIEKLDEVLKEVYSEHFTHFFKNKNDGHINEVSFDAGTLFFRFTKDFHLGEKIPIVENVYEMEEILQKIYDDGYLNDKNRQSNKYEEAYPKQFILNIKGRIFSKNGGYANDEKMNEREKQSQKYKDNLLMLGTWMAAIGTLVLAFVEFVKHYIWHSN